MKKNEIQMWKTQAIDSHNKSTISAAFESFQSRTRENFHANLPESRQLAIMLEKKDQKLQNEVR